MLIFLTCSMTLKPQLSLQFFFARRIDSANCFAQSFENTKPNVFYVSVTVETVKSVNLITFGR